MPTGGIRWRARVEYDKATSQEGQVYGPWRYYSIYGGDEQAFKARSSALPVKYLSITAHFDKLAKAGVINWITASEQDNAYFIVQSSRDGSTWSDIGHVEGNGTTQSRQEYSYEDKTITAGLTYYRLMQVDTDGDREASKIVQVLWKEELGVSLLQNPVQNVLVLTVDADAVLPVRYELVSGSGAVVINGVSQTSTINQEVSSLPAGTYHLLLKDAREVETTQKVLIVR